MEVKGKVVMITGANSGIGLALCERLLSSDDTLHICLACRNNMKAEAARDALKVSHPNSTIEITQVDVGSLKSVYAAAAELRKKYKRIDCIYMNAGIFPVTNVNWSNLVRGTLSGPSKIAHMFSTGHGLLKQMDNTTPEGLKQVFATNVFGHYVLVKELEDILGGDQPTQIVWTSSSNANPESFEIDDIQSANGEEPYSSSKYCTDMMSIGLNKRLNKKNVYSHTTCPGLVLTQITYNILPWWVWYLLMPLFWFVRLLTANVCLTPYNGAESLIWLFSQLPASLKITSKFHSQVSPLGTPYVKEDLLDYDESMVSRLMTEMDSLADEYKSKLQS